MHQTYLSSYDMTYSHQVIINNISKVIRWIAIVFKNDLVINNAVVKYDLPVDQILEYRLSFRNSHSYNVGLSCFHFLLDLFFSEAVEAEPIILCLCILLTTNLDPHLLESLCSTETRICVTVLD